MKKTTVSDKLIFISEVIAYTAFYFAVYAITAIPAERYTVGDVHNGLTHTCYLINTTLFFLFHGVHTTLMPSLLRLLLTFVIMGLLTWAVKKLFRMLFKKRTP